MPAQRPLTLDDEHDDDPDDYRPGPPVFNRLSGVVKWGCVGVGGILAVTALKVPAIHAGAVAGLACFLGIVARIAQAEEHRTPPLPWPNRGLSRRTGPDAGGRPVARNPTIPSVRGHRRTPADAPGTD